MHSTTKQQTTAPAIAPLKDPRSESIPDKPAIIASRKRCAADGVGLSHYILMDRHDGKESGK